MQRREAATPVAGARDTGVGEISRPPHTFWGDALRRLLRNRLAVAGLVVVGLLVIVAIFAPLIASNDPIFQDYSATQETPSLHHLFGTDTLGRDVFSRMVYGARISLSVGIFTQLIILGIGIPVGLVAAFAGGRTDNFIMRGVDIVYAFPDLLLIVLLRALLGGGLYMLFLAIGLVSWVNIARLMRGQILSIKEQEFVTAARASGASNGHIMLAHLLPNALGPIIVSVAFGIPRAIFQEAALSFIGIGVKPPTPSWGVMIYDGYQSIFAIPYAVLFPAIAIALLMLAFTFLGDGLRDALDPRMAEEARRI